jgi:predicted ferric reductase
MTETSPTPHDARALLDEAKGRAETVRRSEKQLRWTLLLVAAMYLVTAVLLSFNPRQGNRLIGTALLVTFLVALVLAVYLGWRVRAWSRAAVLWFVAAMAVFLVWNGAVIWVSIATGWWGPKAPGIHFGGTAAVAVIPLLVGTWLFGRR